MIRGADRAMAGRAGREWPGAVVATSLLLAAAAGAAVAYYPTWAANADAGRLLVRFFPPGMEWLREKILATALGGMPGWLAVHHFYKGLTLLGCIYAVLFGACPVAREFETGTAPLLFSRPAARWRIGLWIYGAGLAAVWGPVILSTAALPPMARAVGEALPWGGLVRGGILAGLALTVVYSYSFLFSCLSDSQARAAFWAGGVTMGMILLAVLTEVRRASLFFYFDPVVYGRLLQGDPVPQSLACACVAGSAALAWGGIAALSRRDA